MGSPVATVGSGLVRVSVRVPEPVETAWRALRDPARLAMWFGDLDQPWHLGRTGRVEFGDGDFFVLTPTEIVDGRVLEFDWSFLGVGPVQRIRWTVTGAGQGAEVRVEDHDPRRSPVEASQMVAGWTDFLRRLATYLTTGERSRYAWRADIDGSVDLPPGDCEPLRLETLYRWLPVASDGFRPRWFFVVDEDGPRRFRIDDWDLEPAGRLAFTVAIPGAEGGTRCVVLLDRTEHGTRLRFSHTGWGELGGPAGRGGALRGRFAATWIAALEAARELAAR